MHKIWIVARREFYTTLKTKTFVIAVVLMPVLMGGSIALQAALEGRVDTETKKIAVLDRSGALFEPLAAEAERRNEQAIFDEDTGRQTDPKFELVRIEPRPDDAEAQLLDLSEQIREKELFAFVVIDDGILATTPSASGPPVAYFSDQPTYRDVQRWLRRVITGIVTSQRLAQAGLDENIVQQAMMPVAVGNLGLVTRDASGEIKPAEQVNEAAAFLLPFGMLMLMFLAITITTQPLLHGVLEEKMQRIAEVLLGSVSPFDLMMGKLIGYVGVALTLVALYLAGGIFVLDRFGYGDLIPVSLIAWFIVFTGLAILMYGALFLAAGSCCNDLREAQNLMTPIWLLIVLPMFAIGPLLEHPNSTFAVGLSLFPTATPMAMALRLAIPPGVPYWQLAVGMAGTIATTFVFVWAAGRIFRVGMLLQGKPPKIVDIARWVVRG